MSGAHARRGPRSRIAIGGAAAVVALGAAIGCWYAAPHAGPASSTGAAHNAPPHADMAPLVGMPRTGTATPTRAPSAVLPPLPNGPTGPAHAARARAATAAEPVRISIPSIGVSSTLEHLTLLPDGTLQPPTRWGRAGWYADGPHPGDPGPAVIAGHIDSVSGPAVFYRLHELRPGAVVTVRDARGTSYRFLVDGSRSYPKNRFPTAAVYGPTPLPVLRLVTCTGDFDYAQHSYLDNLVVSAHLVEDQRRP